jgi:hypothetical protein
VQSIRCENVMMSSHTKSSVGALCFANVLPLQNARQRNLDEATDVGIELVNYSFSSSLFIIRAVASHNVSRWAATVVPAQVVIKSCNLSISLSQSRSDRGGTLRTDKPSNAPETRFVVAVD